MSKTFSIMIGGERWRYRVIPKLQDDYVAKTTVNPHRMDFVAEHVRFGVIVHELIHAHCHYLYLNSSNIGFKDYEEIIAEMMEDKILLIVEQAQKMLAKLQGGSSDKTRVHRVSQDSLRKDDVNHQGEKR